MQKIYSFVSDELKLIEESFCNFVNLNDSVFKDLSDFLQGKSKRIRSVISLLYLKANGTIINENIIKLLFATELIHNASLLHDDVTDDSHLRRNIPTLFDKYGSKLSVISGDYILSAAVEKLLNLNNEKILNIYLKAVKKMSEAEISQFFSRNTDITLEKYINIIKGKTSSLFAACLESAALLSNIDTDKAKSFGNNFGIIFQINNDMESKSAENDKINGVKTAVDLLGIEKTLALKDNYKEELRKILVNIPDNEYKFGIEDLINIL